MGLFEWALPMYGPNDALDWLLCSDWNSTTKLGTRGERERGPRTRFEQNGESEIISLSCQSLVFSQSLHRHWITPIHYCSFRIRLRNQILQKIHLDVCSRSRPIFRKSYEKWFPQVIPFPVATYFNPINPKCTLPHRFLVNLGKKKAYLKVT